MALVRNGGLSAGERRQDHGEHRSAAIAFVQEVTLMLAHDETEATQRS
jgi:hypothetical protein